MHCVVTSLRSDAVGCDAPLGVIPLEVMLQSGDATTGDAVGR